MKCEICRHEAMLAIVKVVKLDTEVEQTGSLCQRCAIGFANDSENYQVTFLTGFSHSEALPDSSGDMGNIVCNLFDERESEEEDEVWKSPYFHREAKECNRCSRMHFEEGGLCEDCEAEFSKSELRVVETRKPSEVRSYKSIEHFLASV